ncbi:MAG: hypothetical protein E5W55_05690 [Mesorhizobium sp.]|nr:MAG: hypothetical protein E5W55_05690 [Mesorhizobium sp.]
MIEGVSISAWARAPGFNTEGRQVLDRTALQPREQLLTYVRSNRGAIVNYAKRYRAGLRVATILGESAVNSVVGKRMVKKQQMRWSLHGAHMLMQVRVAEINGELRNRLRAPFRQPEPNMPPISSPNASSTPA